jgi:CBS domain-containing protein
VAETDPVAFLRSAPPFDALPDAAFDLAARAVEVVFHAAGEQLVRAGEAPFAHLYIVRKGAVRLERDGHTLQLVEEGECFGFTSLLTGEASIDVVVEDDLVALRLPGEVFRSLLADARFARQFTIGLGDRLRQALEDVPAPAFALDLTREVGALVRGPAVWVEPGTPVRDAARVMRERRISSVLVRGTPPAIVTDRDLRDHVLAAGLGPDLPVDAVATRPLRAIAAAAPLYEAWLFLLDAGVHHLPVERDGAIAGVVTSGDLLKGVAQTPIAVLRSVERLAGRDALRGYGAKVTEMVAALLSAGLDAPAIAGLVARLDDALVRRVLRWAEADLGPAPAPWAWLAFGSEGRMEQTLVTDQDNGLVYADAGAADRPWFAALAERVNADLEAAGFPSCRGDHVARHAHGTVSEWAARFARSIDAPDAHDAALLLDVRPVAGGLDVAALEDAPRRGAADARFLRALARDAIAFAPPPSLALRLRGAGSTVDLKWQGISPVVFLARCYAVEVGASDRGTLGRLEAAVRAGLMDADLFAAVSGAYRFLLGLRLRVQLGRIAGGAPPTNEVTLSELSSIDRARLKDAFRAIRAWQDKAAYHWQVER